MLNPFFLQGSKTEQGLVQDLINESIQIHGVDVYYLPRQYMTEKTIIKEVVESEFNFAYPIEAYVNSYDGYNGQGTILSKFGIQELDDLSLIISKERYEVYISSLISNLPNIKLSERPKEGDLIYFPYGNRLFEIKYVEHESPFYQLRQNYVYELRCELFRYQNEVINTGIDFIDNPEGVDGDGTGDNLSNRPQFSVTQTLQLIGIGETASAITSIVDGGVRFVNISNRGSGYTSAPKVSFSTSPLGGITATGITTMIGGIGDLCEPNKNLLRVQRVDLINPGSGYTISPNISFTGGGGSGAEATSTIGDGIVGIITITNSGSGYINPPKVNIIGISSISAKANAIINASGEVTQIRISNAGLGYTQAPEIQIESPNIMVGSGTYEFNESVIGSLSNATARVKSWNSTTKKLELSNSSGQFIPGDIVTGQVSNTSYSVRSSDLNNVNDSYGQNDVIQREADKILDFNEINPFGTP